MFALKNTRHQAARFILSLAVISLSVMAQAEQVLKSGEFKSSVVELYTSEGCSSCPPADKFLSRLGKTEEADSIIPLAFHVDYWDYIGWEDPYAQAKFTQRQRHIGKVNGQSSIYTPEFVVDGAEARGGKRIADSVQATQGELAEADITLTLFDDETNGTIKAQVQIQNLQQNESDKAVVQVVLTENNLSSQIKAGENKGRELKHDHVVRFLSAPQIAVKGGNHAFEIKLDPAWVRESLKLAVWVKQETSGKTLQALQTKF